MKLYFCDNCQNLLYFENNVCLNCKHTVGFDSSTLSLITLLPGKENELLWFHDKKKKYRFCKNAEYGTCNWLVDADDPSEWCRACAFNRIIPTLTNGENLRRWSNIEIAKHRLIFSLLRLHLPLSIKKENEEEGLAFDFMADESSDEKEKIMTGHEDGVITINIAEADDIEREMARKQMDEVYRTVLGHFRHEIGHYYWDRLIDNTNNINGFRKIFGDERVDYAEALEKYYKEPVMPNWNQQYISAYATAHPWEDWAETWAHYLHIIDTLETAYAFGLSVDPLIAEASSVLSADIKSDPYSINNFEMIFRLWLPLTFVLNSLNRSMGLQDTYPFVITQSVKEKMKFIHSVVRTNAAQS